MSSILGITSFSDAVKSRVSGFLGLKDFHVEVKRSLQAKEVTCSIHYQMSLEEEDLDRGNEAAARELLKSIEVGIRQGALVAAVNEDLLARVRELEALLERVSGESEAKLEQVNRELEKARGLVEELERFKSYYDLEFQMRHGKETA